MKLRLGAAVLAAALLPLTTFLVPAPVSAGTVDTTPPVVGSCHDLTYDEGYEESDPDPAVSCSARHTSVTSWVFTLDDPDWTDTDKVFEKISPKCVRKTNDFFHDEVRSLQMSTYDTWIFLPTRVEREAGAAWVRCDVALYGYKSLKPLPTDGVPTLGSPPLDDNVARCRKGKADDYNVTSCDKAHRYRATAAFKYPNRVYPGLKKIVAWTRDKCGHALRTAFYYEAPTKAQWIVSHRYSVCLKPTRR